MQNGAGVYILKFTHVHVPLGRSYSASVPRAKPLRWSSMWSDSIGWASPSEAVDPAVLWGPATMDAALTSEQRGWREVQRTHGGRGEAKATPRGRGHTPRAGSRPAAGLKPAIPAHVCAAGRPAGLPWKLQPRCVSSGDPGLLLPRGAFRLRATVPGRQSPCCLVCISPFPLHLIMILVGCVLFGMFCNQTNWDVKKDKKKGGKRSGQGSLV